MGDEQWQVITGDCLEVMPTLAPGSVDAILTDLPYGTTACSWDSVIPFEPMWAAIRHVLKPRGVFVTTASQPFTSALVMSNPKWFKYTWVWRKSKPNGWQHAKNRPMMAHEDVAVFSAAPMGHASTLGDRRMNYNPIGVSDAGVNILPAAAHGRTMGARPNQTGREYVAQTGFPSSVLEYQNVIGTSAIHPTQKPVALYEYLIRTYTNEGELVLDMCAGSGTTGVAAINTGRRVICIEQREDYADIARARIAKAAEQARQAELPL